MRIYVCCTVSAQKDFEQIKEVAQYCKDADILLYFTVNKSNQTLEEAQNVKDTELESDQLKEIFIRIKDLKKQGWSLTNNDKNLILYI